MQGLRARVDYILKHNYVINRIFNYSVSSVLRFLGLFVKQDEKLVLFSGLSRGYNDSPRSIYEYLLSNPSLYSGYRFVWGLEDPSEKIPGDAKKVKADTLKYFIISLKAKYWITSVNIERSLHFKKKSCRYLNTWHGTPFKYIGNDAIGRKDFNFNSVDLFCYASQHEKEIYKRAFKLKENSLIPTGLPRNDELYKVTKDEIKEIKERLNILSEKKVILYAPTWRDSVDGGKTCAIAPPITPKKWKDELGDNYVILFRSHGYTNSLIGLDFNDVILDFSDYPCINDLFKISDILISDYSASMADFSILERPILCFVYDYEDYKENRGLYLDYDKDMPSGRLKSEDEVISYIQNMDYNLECEKVRIMLKNKLITFGGEATKECVEKLFI